MKKVKSLDRSLDEPSIEDDDEILTNWIMDVTASEHRDPSGDGIPETV